MSFWDDITGKVSEGSKIVADKAKEVSEIANLRAQIVSCDNVLVKKYKELGKAYYAAHKDDIDKEFAEITTAIDEAEAKKAELNEKLADRKGTCKDDAQCATDTVVDDVVEKAGDAVETVENVIDDINQ